MGEIEIVKAMIIVEKEGIHGFGIVKCEELFVYKDLGKKSYSGCNRKSLNAKGRVNVDIYLF